MYYEDDRPRPIPEEYLRMTPEELERESERVYQEYRKKQACTCPNRGCLWIQMRTKG